MLMSYTENMIIVKNIDSDRPCKTYYIKSKMPPSLARRIQFYLKKSSLMEKIVLPSLSKQNDKKTVKVFCVILTRVYSNRSGVVSRVLAPDVPGDQGWRPVPKVPPRYIPVLVLDRSQR